MNRRARLLILLWVAPAMGILGSSCGLFASNSCEGIPPILLESGTFVTDSWRTGDGPPSVHALATGNKTLDLNVEGGQATLEYTDSEGRVIVEQWALGSATVE